MKLACFVCSSYTKSSTIIACPFCILQWPEWKRFLKCHLFTLHPECTFSLFSSWFHSPTLFSDPSEKGSPSHQPTVLTAFHHLPIVRLLWHTLWPLLQDFGSLHHVGLRGQTQRLGDKGFYPLNYLTRYLLLSCHERELCLSFFVICVMKKRL